MLEVGRICVKLAGRDAGKKAVIVEVIDKKYVTLDGEVRRRKCNVLHLEPTSKVIEIKKGASHSDVKKEFEKLGLKVLETKPKAKKPQQKEVPAEKESKPKKVKAKK